MNQIIETPRLVIRPYGEADRAALAELLTNHEIKKTFMIPDFKTEEEIARMVEKLWTRSFSEAHFERGIYAGDSCIGFVNDVETEDDAIEIGYVIHPAFHNKGYATEMLRAVIPRLLEKYTAVIAGAFSENAASIRVMQKCGMEKLAKTDDILYRGKMHHCVYYGIRRGTVRS